MPQNTVKLQYTPTAITIKYLCQKNSYRSTGKLIKIKNSRYLSVTRYLIIKRCINSSEMETTIEHIKRYAFLFPRKSSCDTSFFHSINMMKISFIFNDVISAKWKFHCMSTRRLGCHRRWPSLSRNHFAFDLQNKHHASSSQVKYKMNKSIHEYSWFNNSMQKMLFNILTHWGRMPHICVKESG